MELKLEWRYGSGGSKLRGWQAVPLVGTILFVVGSCFLVIGLVLGLVTSNFIDHSVQTRATVISLQALKSNDGETFAPVFEFADANGREHTITSHSSSNPAGFSVGETVRILYSPGDPEDARIDTLWQLWGIPLIFCPLGGVFALVGAVLLLISRRRSKRLAGGADRL